MIFCLDKTMIYSDLQWENKEEQQNQYCLQLEKYPE